MYKVNNLNDAMDLVQETFLAALTAIDSGREPDDLKSWLVTVLNRRYYDFLRRKYRRPTVSMDVIFDLPDENDSYERIEKSEEAEKIRRCLARLTKMYREVMVKYYVYGKSIKTISLEPGIPENTVKTRLRTGREHIGKDFTMGKFKQQSYEPEAMWLAVSGRDGTDNSPFSLVGDSRIERNLLIPAYEKPLTIPELADAIGISTTYIEPIVEKLVRGELMKKVSDRIYTDFIIFTEEDRNANLSCELALADKLYEKVWEILKRGVGELETFDFYGRQRKKAKQKPYAVR